jgi:hypothetical protein
MTPKILMCPLVTDDYDRAVRAIRSSFNQKDHNILFAVHVVVNSKDEEFIETITRFCKFNNIRFTVSQCDGTPSTGKNAVFDVFKESDCTHMSQLDGDDFFYPIFLKHIERHLKKYPGTDVLSTIPVDSIYKNYEDGMIQLSNGIYSLVWGSNYHNYESHKTLYKDKMMMGEDGSNAGRFILYSKRIIDLNFRYDPTFIVGEDKKLHFDFLNAHQRDEISYWFTTASDTWVRDTMSFGVQKKHSNTIIDGEYYVVPDNDTTNRLIEHVNEIMDIERTSPGEIPIDYAPLYLSYKEKNQFLEDFL